MKILGVLIKTLLVALLAAFLFANRQEVALSLDPTSVTAPALTTPALPLWVWLTAALFIGLALGAMGMWISSSGSRAKVRSMRQAMAGLKRENEVLAARTAGEPPLVIAESR